MAKSKYQLKKKKRKGKFIFIKKKNQVVKNLFRSEA